MRAACFVAAFLACLPWGIVAEEACDASSPADDVSFLQHVHLTGAQDIELIRKYSKSGKKATQVPTECTCNDCDPHGGAVNLYLPAGATCVASKSARGHACNSDSESMEGCVSSLEEYECACPGTVGEKATRQELWFARSWDQNPAIKALPVVGGAPIIWSWAGTHHEPGAKHDDRWLATSRTGTQVCWDFMKHSTCVKCVDWEGTHIGCDDGNCGGSRVALCREAAAGDFKF